MFESVLIANRGEIACRIARTCRRLGIRSIAVYSDADAGARHVREADSAVRIGPPDATRSYLDADAIIAAALASGASAIHPGYGFLSESTRLVERCNDNGIVWIGPRAEVIEKMGSKIESKRIAARVGVPCVPGYHGDNQEPQHLLAQAHEIGVPLLIKASAGGGGKGMRRVDDLAEFVTLLGLAKQEALRAFGDERVLIEKLILRPRHLEVQLAGDQHGNLVHLYERECSIQRNYQKVIEEAPAPRLPVAVRTQLLDAAVKLGREIGYDSLGTVEFVLGEGAETPYFLEMNTRLQVEHPVTETVTGLDLVEWQIRIALGEPLPLEQTAIAVTGWAIEARINCEDPARGHRPELGTVGRYVEPSGAGMRTDSGVAGGSEIPSQYDSMVAKLIGFGATRAEAVDRLRDALAGFEAAGIGTNQSLLRAIVDHPMFRAGRLTTGFLGEAFAGGWTGDVSALRDARIAAALFALRTSAAISDTGSAPDYWQRQSGYRFMAAAGRRAEARLRVDLEGETVALAIARDGDAWQVRFTDEAPLRVRAEWPAADQLVLTPAHGTPRRFTIGPDHDITVVNHLGMRWRFQVISEVRALARVAAREGTQASEVISEMPGAITTIHVMAGDAVEPGQVLVVMEAMKLIFELAAPRAGTVAAVRCEVGEIVPRGQTLVQLEPLPVVEPSGPPA
ncbi:MULTISPECIES: biotin carboxylase N-terminal domain-containing protein [Pseudomonadota]|jgi:acetyl/propionyl-CoA carboxylase alpha subunit|uniref:acetyl/propionyl/methylcrotonyl-CoA carboxylase subunit alpha n=1 Tax=Pseudomonadota TaxID=1224 RepID=UPI000BCA26F4|nr:MULTISPECIES: biotin carboxylase N-terminal domain-containing protein [Pseudomonadota]OYY39342.1 MAG: biotin carboxylase [Polaromonas sp. 35-63-35]OYZ20441.1 MAG: biotin carboxylase [Polaromonas sp. 16-63-31]OYZ80646.1 MAG: biotin carboxylase [Polaromonas sp. 24-63-21]OZA51709.1 MAG: biotin carboxylase [Polaromonas sp. 17-63-33]OZA89824.1 MAG: biotin carboxylase [Polaromonas sp. 39-63-25]